MGILPDIQFLKAFGNPQRGGFFRQDCLLCGDDSPTLLCTPCARELPAVTSGACPRCGLPVLQNIICGHCLKTPPFFDATCAAFRYIYPINKLIQSFKYGHRLALAPYFGAHLAALVRHRVVADVIIPLPLHLDRLKERGFNQAMELARPIAESLEIPLLPHLCQRTRNTGTQAGLPWKERRKNVLHAFHCGTPLDGKNILLVDDVMTTGASLNECARTLRLQGAKHITVLVVARALRD